MKIKNRIFFIISITFFYFLSISLVAKAQKSNNSLVLANIEVLEEDENHTGGVIECHDEGHLYCPLNKKSEYKVVMVYQ